ncbi:hypothetical protein CHS0354_037305 [Potamilus streckersoni]|uniref:Uncharacterized protein n=1 Tax=Potamilus streckersoni TaxID=2493646 RepID=A0AAE0TK41_9BIVA|nr:hypothetical protein CHS0354_037305 [Potamilus streckersoni]
MASNYTIYPIKGFIMYRSLQLGNPNRLIYGVNSWGNVCNQGNKKIQNVSLSGLDIQINPLIFRCTPKALTRRIDCITSTLNSIFNLIDDNFIEKCVNDVTVSWKEIGYLCGISIVVAFFTVLFLRFFAGIIIWVVYVATRLGTLAATGFAWYNYYRVKTEYDALLESKRSKLDANRIRNWLIGSICVTIATVIVILIFRVMRKHQAGELNR